jgi:hypothetical protein
MKFRNFFVERVALLKRGVSIENLQIAWKRAIMREINLALYIQALKPEDDLTMLALYRLLQRYYAERGSNGFEDIVKLWSYLIKKDEEINIKKIIQ